MILASTGNPITDETLIINYDATTRDISTTHWRQNPFPAKNKFNIFNKPQWFYILSNENQNQNEEQETNDDNLINHIETTNSEIESSFDYLSSFQNNPRK